MNVKLVLVGYATDRFFDNHELIGSGIPYFLVQNQTENPLYFRLWKVESLFLLQISSDNNFLESVVFNLQERASAIEIRQESFQQALADPQSISRLFFPWLNRAYLLGF